MWLLILVHGAYMKLSGVDIRGGGFYNELHTQIESNLFNFWPKIN